MEITNAIETLEAYQKEMDLDFVNDETLDERMRRMYKTKSENVTDCIEVLHGSRNEVAIFGVQLKESKFAKTYTCAIQFVCGDCLYTDYFATAEEAEKKAVSMAKSLGFNVHGF